MTAPVTAKPTGTPESGMVLMVAAVLIVPFGDALSKSLTGLLNPFEIAFWRFLIQVLVLAGTIGVVRRSLARGPWLLLIGGGLSAAAVLSALIAAFVTMPIATAIAIFFIEPLLLTLLSAWLLKEKTGWRRYVAVAVGLIGVIVVIRPSWDIFGWASLLPLAAATGFAGNAVIIRKLSPTMDAISMQFWFALVASVAIGAGLLIFGRLELFSFQAGFAADGPWLKLIFMGALSAFTFFLFAEAFRRTPASVLAPFQYIEIIGATIVGYLFFRDFPDFWTWVGTAIILASGLYVFHRERRTERSQAGASQRLPK